MVEFEFLVEGFYDDVLLLNNTYLLESKTGILSLEHVGVEKWISFFPKINTMAK